MKLLSFLLVFSLTPQVVLSADAIEGVCNGIKSIYDCKAIITIPTGAKVKTCKNKFFETDPCKTKFEYNYPCPTWRKPGRTCKGWTCAPGTRETWIDTPCGLTITTKKLDICQTVRGAMGNVGKQYINTIGAVCNCLPKFFEMAGRDLFKSVSSGSALTGAASAMIGEIMQLQKCAIDNGFNVKDNKEEVMRGDLASTDGWTVIQATEIDLATYGELAAAIGACVLGSCDTIGTFFVRYLEKSKEVMEKQITTALNQWINVFDKIEEQIKKIGASVEVLVSRLDGLPAKIKAIEEKACKSGNCVVGEVTSFMQQDAAWRRTKLTKRPKTSIRSRRRYPNLQRRKKAATDGAAAVESMIDITRATIEVAKSIPDSETIIQLIVSGQITEIQDIIESIKITKDVAKSSSAIVEGLLAKDWSNVGSLSPPVAAGLQEIQDLLRTEISEPLRDVTNTLQGLGAVLNAFPIKDGRFSFKSGVSSYRRWSTVSMSVPCSRQKTQRYEISGFKGSFSYPEFYSCPYGPKELPWPNHHIPYFKFKVG
ncbi:unnamed protein product [Parascedosporium putredinis]|uniref:Uncharacterized protein n=1 Tax=Parascedosporium putredinis TaxID=1442378 RepID=A0A9P1MAX7_9PEZI|nr:unnamed protein product [Parascedosporium putredinis]CAI7993572.1 unnamed protein product [Parascedosporium putredinis]